MGHGATRGSIAAGQADKAEAAERMLEWGGKGFEGEVEIGREKV